MPLAKKKKGGKKKKKVSEESRERKKLDKTDTRAMKFLLSLDQYGKLLSQRLLPWYENNERLLLRYFLSLPKAFDFSLLEDFVKTIKPLEPADPTFAELSGPDGEKAAPNALYTHINIFKTGLRDLGAPYTEMEIHILCRIIQFTTTVRTPEEEAEPPVTDGEERAPSPAKPSPSPVPAGSEPEEPPTILTHPEQFQDLIIKLSGSLKVLKNEAQNTWELLRSDIPQQYKAPHNLPWISDILKRRKIAEALKKKKKKRKKKKKGQGPKGEPVVRCKHCNLILTETYSGPKMSEWGYVKVTCRLARRDNVKDHPMHVTVSAQSHWLFAQVAEEVIIQTDLPTKNILFYTSVPVFTAGLEKPSNNVRPIPLNLSLMDNGIPGGPREEPVELLLYYDFLPPPQTAKCPILNAEALYDYGESRAYRQTTQDYQFEYAKSYRLERARSGAAQRDFAKCHHILYRQKLFEDYFHRYGKWPTAEDLDNNEPTDDDEDEDDSSEDDTTDED